MLGKKAEAGKIKIKVKEVKKVKASIKKDVLQVQLFSFQ